MVKKEEKENGGWMTKVVKYFLDCG